MKGIFEWIQKSKERKYIVISSISAGAALAIFNFLFLQEFTTIYTFIYMLAGVTAVGPSLILKWRKYKEVEEIEDKFPEFLRNVVEGVRSGMTLPKAIMSAADANYRALNPYVERMASQIDWGMPFHEVLERFANEIGSRTLKRTVTTIIEAHRSGGDVGEILDAVGESVRKIERLRAERSSSVHSQILTGYMIYLIFLGVMIGLQTFLLPTLTFQQTAQAGTLGITAGTQASPEQLIQMYNVVFRRLIIIQGLFSGLAIGKMAQGTIVAGFRHSLVMVLLGFTLFTILTAVLGGINLGSMFGMPMGGAAGMAP